MRKPHASKRSIQARRAVGLAFLGVLVSAVGILPSLYFINLYSEITGRSASLLVKIIIPFIWFLLFYLLFQVVVRCMVHFRMKQGYERPPNMFENIMEALDRIAVGDYNIQVAEDNHFHYGGLADKVNKLAKDLSSMEQMRQEFVSNVSHEIQSPLTSISGFATLLKKKDLPLAQRLHYADVIETESKRLSKLSDNLLKLSVLDSDQSPFSPKPFRLDKQLEGVLLMLEPQWSDKNLEPDVSLAPVTYSGDEDLLSQVWINLLHNSIKFTEPGGTISVLLTEAEGKITCTLSDTGAGIPEENLVHIFERFYKADKARDRSLGGNGLGLSLVKKIVDLHGGAISVKSKDGVGTTFTVSFPANFE